MSAPFVSIFLSFAAGVLCSEFIQFAEWLLIPSVAVAMTALRFSSFRIALCAGLLFILFLAVAFVQKEEEQYKQNELREWVRLHEKETVAIDGTLTRTPELSDDYFVLQVKIESVSGVTCRGVSRLTVSGELNEVLIVGDHIQSFARMRLPKNFRTEGAFDYEQYLRAQGIHVLGTIKSSKLVHKTHGDGSFRSYFSAIRFKWIRNTIHSFSSANAGILRALWLDDRGGLNQGQERVLVDSGIFHVIAISGFHISVLLVILFFAVKRFLSFRWAIALACLCLFVYFLILEGRSSVTRSFLSFLILAFAIWRYEQIRLANWICLSAFIQLVLNPHELYDSGFQLTYLSTAAILFLVVPLCRKFRNVRRLYRYALNFVVAGAIVQIILIPYQIYLFHRIPLYTFFANIVAVPVSSVLIACSTLLMPLPMLANFLRQPVQGTIAALMNSAGLFADYGVRIMPSPPFYWIVAFYILLGIAIVVAKRRLKVLFFFLALLLLTIMIIPRQPRPSGALQIHFLDVGQGDAILLEYPDGTYDLVDGGGFFNLEALDTGQAILLPYLCRIGVTKLHRVFLTHAHADHMNGLLSLMRYIPVEEFYVTRQPIGAKNYQSFLRTMNRTPIAVSQGKRYEQAGVKLEVLSPDDSRKTNRVANDDSLVLLIEYRGKRILLTGDVELDAEERVSRRLTAAVDYVKVPHHGSKTSSSSMLLRSLRPRAAFISVGSNNWFGHPDPGVLERYRKNHVVVYRTDIHGTIRLRITDTEAHVEID